ncbi:MAG: T9SS type A sorting domain-containing protein [Bacteroidales bacterium]
MKGILWIIIAGTLSLGQYASAQQDTLRRGSMHLKSIRIIGNDTIVDERHIDLDGNQRDASIFFRFGDGFDTLIQGEEWFRFDEDTDSLFKGFFRSPFNLSFPGMDTSMMNPRYGMPEQWLRNFPDMNMHHFREINPETFQMPDQRRWGGYIPMKQPSFSVEDVAIYPKKNSVKNFHIKPLPGTSVLLVEADLDNKKSVYTVYDQLGRTIHQEKIGRMEGDFRRVLDMAELKTGTYFVEIKNGKSTKKKRLTIR